MHNRYHKRDNGRTNQKTQIIYAERRKIIQSRTNPTYADTGGEYKKTRTKTKIVKQKETAKEN